jgi:DNA polymerase III alpha subunit
MPDIDIDFLNREHILNKITHIRARRDNTNHNTGIYVQAIPHDPITNLAGIDYKQAEQRGYFKIDLLNVGIYNGVKNEEHLIKLMETEPLWELLIQDDFTNLLFHLNGHGDIIRKTPPTSVEQLAAVLAILRPAKRYLIGKDWNTIMNEIWLKPDSNDYYFKKSHAIAYAIAVIVQMNLICENISYDYS